MEPTLHFQFFNDYSETAHPACLEALQHEPLVQASGYGLDFVSEQAADLIRQRCLAPQAAVHFVAGGTLANLTVLGALLRPVEAVVCVDSGHILTNEAGAIEATGHKLISLPGHQGKLAASDLLAVAARYQSEHVVSPKVVYVSQASELGTVYSLAELQSLRRACDELGWTLFIDGARLGAALASSSADFGWPEIAALADVFYIGGTKNGALLGEAVVITRPDLQTDFRRHLKQRGALMAKGRVVASQFKALFTDDLLLSLARHANQCAQRLQEGLGELGVSLDVACETNLVFPIFSVDMSRCLAQRYGFHVMRRLNEHEEVVRLVTSWATPLHKVEDFLADVAAAQAALNRPRP
jgi:threonine aldolase